MPGNAVQIIIGADGTTAIAATKEVSAAFKKLGVDSVAGINAQKDQASAAYNTIKNSGVASAQEIQQAQGAMHKQIAQLNEQLVGNYGSMTSQIKAHWLGLTAGIASAMLVIGQARQFIETGAKALQTETAFKGIADSAHVNAEAVLADWQRASAGTVTATELMQRGIKGMTQGLSAADMMKVWEMARQGAITAGMDVATAGEQITNSIANNLPKAMVRFGLVSKEEMQLINKAMAAGVEDVHMLDIAYDNFLIKQATIGPAVDKTNEALQRNRAAIRELGEDIGILTVKVLGAFIEGIKDAAESLKGLNAVQQQFVGAAPYGVASQPSRSAAGWARGMTTPYDMPEAIPTAEEAAELKKQDLAQLEKATNAKMLREMRQGFEGWKVSVENLNPALLETDRHMNEINKAAAKFIEGKPGAAPGTTIAIPRSEVEAQQAIAAGYLQQQALLKNAQMNAKAEQEGVKQAGEYAKEYETLFNQVAGSRVNAEQVALAKIDTELRKRLGEAAELYLKDTWDYENLTRRKAITAEEYEALITKDYEDAGRQRLALTTKNQAAMATAESEQRLAAIDYQQKMGLISPAQGISAKLGENQSLLSSLEGWKAGLEAAGQTGDQVYQSILQKIKAVEKATTDLTVANQVYVGSFGEGMKIEILKYAASVNSAFNAGASLANTASKSMESSFTSFFDATGKKFLDFNSLALSVFGDIERQAIKLAVSQPLTNSIMGSLGSLFGGGTQPQDTSGYGAVGFGALGGALAAALWAKGGAFYAGRVVAMAQGDVVEGPTLFRMASGAGLMGEEGPEAVMPLRRTSSGDLGVRAAGTGAPSMVTHVTINTPPGTKVAKQKETVRLDGRQWVKNLSIDLAATDLEYQSAHGLR